MTDPKTAATDVRPSKFARVPAGIALFVIFALSILGTVPFAPVFPNASLDSSWAYALNVAVARNIQFGRDIVFTFGPLASAYTGLYHPATDMLMLVVSTWLTVATVLAFWKINESRNLGWLLFIPFVLSQTGRDVLLIGLPRRDVLLIGLPVALLFASVQPIGNVLLYRTTLVVGMVALGLLLLLKGSTFPTVLFCGLATLYVTARRSRALAIWSFVCASAAALLAWSAAGQHLSNLPSYFVSQSSLIAGYTSAMSVDGSWVDLAVYSGSALTLLIALWILKTPYRWLLLSASALFLFLCFKAGFVRHDSHAWIAAFAPVFLGYLCLMTAPGLRTALPMAIALMSWYYVSPAGSEQTPVSVVQKFGVDVADALDDLGDRLTGSVSLKARFEHGNQMIREGAPIPMTNGTADLYPSDLAVLFANGADWRPRPAFQSYLAYTPQLARRNSDWLHRAGPSRIYFKVDPIDSHYPALEDGLSWVSLLDDYEPTGFAGDYLILDRAAASGLQESLDHKRDLSSIEVGKSIDLPNADSPIMAFISIKESLTGKLMSLFFKPPALHLVAEYADGRKISYRYIPGMGETGFVVSPTITSAAEFAMLRTPLWKTYLRDKLPVRIGLVGNEGAAKAWESLYAVRFATLPIKAIGEAQDVVFPPPRQLPSLTDLPVTADCHFDEFDGKASTGSPLHSPPALLKVRGWAAISAKDGVSSDQVFVAMVAPDGSAQLFPMVTRLERSDILEHYAQDSLKMAGYEGVINTLQAPPVSEMRVVQSRDGKLYACNKTLRTQRAGP